MDSFLKNSYIENEANNESSEFYSNDFHPINQKEKSRNDISRKEFKINSISNQTKLQDEEFSNYIGNLDKGFNHTLNTIHKGKSLNKYNKDDIKIKKPNFKQIQTNDNKIKSHYVKIFSSLIDNIFEKLSKTKTNLNIVDKEKVINQKLFDKFIELTNKVYNCIEDQTLIGLYEHQNQLEYSNYLTMPIYTQDLNFRFLKDKRKLKKVINKKVIVNAKNKSGSKSIFIKSTLESYCNNPILYCNFENNKFENNLYGSITLFQPYMSAYTTIDVDLVNNTDSNYEFYYSSQDHYHLEYVVGCDYDISLFHKVTNAKVKLNADTKFVIYDDSIQYVGPQSKFVFLLNSPNRQYCCKTFNFQPFKV